MISLISSNPKKTTKLKEIAKVPAKLDSYKIEETIGEGTYGKVKLATHIKLNEKVAIKFINKKRLTNKGDDERIRNEIKIISKLNHPNILKAFEVFEDENNYYIVMERPIRGDLFNYICSKGRLSMDEASFIFYQLVNGIQYLHENNVVHRDTAGSGKFSKLGIQYVSNDKAGQDRQNNGDDGSDDRFHLQFSSDRIPFRYDIDIRKIFYKRKKGYRRADHQHGVGKQFDKGKNDLFPQLYLRFHAHARTDRNIDQNRRKDGYKTQKQHISKASLHDDMNGIIAGLIAVIILIRIFLQNRLFLRETIAFAADRCKGLPFKAQDYIDLAGTVSGPDRYGRVFIETLPEYAAEQRVKHQQGL